MTLGTPKVSQSNGRQGKMYFDSSHHDGCVCIMSLHHDDIIKWKHFPRYWPFVRGIHRSLVNSPHKCPWRGALMFSMICAWTKGWVNNRYAVELRHHRTHYNVTVIMVTSWYENGLLQRPLIRIFHCLLLLLQAWGSCLSNSHVTSILRRRGTHVTSYHFNVPWKL